MATHWDQSNYLANQKQGTIHKKKNSGIQVLVINFFSNPTHKTEIGTASRWETSNGNISHWDQSNYLANQKQGATHKKNISDIQVLVINFFPTPPIKLKLGLQVGGRLVIATFPTGTNKTI
jgi:hypothetical protein